MKPYWLSTLTLEEAQQYSKNGTAILGNPAMKDIVWEKDSPHPKIWINKGYKDADPERFRHRKGWIPAEPNEDYMELYGGTWIQKEDGQWIEPKMGVWYTEENGEWVETPRTSNLMAWWGATWRLSVFALILFSCFSWPFPSFIVYCVLSYIAIGYALLSGELVPNDWLGGFVTWLFSPIVFAFMFIMFALRPPIL